MVKFTLRSIFVNVGLDVWTEMIRAFPKSGVIAEGQPRVSSGPWQLRPMESVMGGHLVP